MTAIQAFQRANHLLRPYARQTAVITTASFILSVWLALMGSLLEHITKDPFAYEQGMHYTDAFLVFSVAAGITIVAGFRNHTDRWLGEATGILTACDLGFLECSSRFWLWRRRTAVTLWAYTLLLLSCLPSLLLLMGAFFTLHHSAGAPDGTLHFILLIHLLIGACLLALLPIRMHLTMAALPLCYLKQPHKSPLTVWRYALQCTAGICGKLLYNRLLFTASFLIPFHWFSAYPCLIAAEMLLCDSNRQKILPDL